MQFARWVSILGHPFVLVVLMVGLAAVRFASPEEAARTIGTVLLITVIPLAVLMGWQVRSGAWENVDASNARERPLLFASGIAGLVVLIGYLFVVHPESAMIRGAVGVVAMLAVCAVATRWLKVSLHMAFASMTAVLMILLGSGLGWLVLVLLPVLAWSRLTLQRHRLAEIIGGVLIGLCTALAIHGL